MAGQRDRDHMVTLPETRDLLILNCRAHGEFRDQRHFGNVPRLARLVAGCREQALAIRTPRDRVDSALVGRAPCLKHQAQSDELE